jgi:hypothetical protein
MKKKSNQIEIKSPFPNVANNWELIDSIEASLNKYLAHPHIHTNIEPSEETERLGRGSIEQILKALKNVLQVIETLRA